MDDTTTTTITIAEAARLLGVHRNTIRNRIKGGAYKAHKVVTPQGETYAIELESLDLPPDTPLTNGTHTHVLHNLTNPSQLSAVSRIEQEEAFARLVQQMLEPVVRELHSARTELGDAREEVGRLSERLATTERERDLLQARLDAPPQPALRPIILKDDLPLSARDPQQRPWWRFWD